MQIDFYCAVEGDPSHPLSLTAFLGNFFQAPIGRFATAEALFQFAKLLNPDEPLDSRYNSRVLDMFTRIPDGHNAWLNGQPKQYLANRFAARSDWRSVNLQIMNRVLRLKYDRNPELRRLLCLTGNAPLNERTDRDSFWGDGHDRKGQNQLGKLHEGLRAEMLANGGNLRFCPATLEEAMLVRPAPAAAALPAGDPPPYDDPPPYEPAPPPYEPAPPPYAP